VTVTSVAPALERPPATPPIGLDPCLAVLDAAIAAAGALGIPTADAEAVRGDAAARLGFPSDAYVVALVGGTGVGKSSLLNALAGNAVSPASALRPTTARPVAWLPVAHREELAGLLAWLGVADGDVRASDGEGLSNVAILDLPDLDSTAADHRRRVEAILPRIDAVVWVTDPEKYADAVLHDDFLATWVPRLDRQLVVVNKADRLSAGQAEALHRDLERDLTRLSRTAGARARSAAPEVILTSAAANAAGGGGRGTADLQRWLAAEVESKAVVRARLTASIRTAVRGLAAAAGLEPDEDPRPLVAEASRSRAVEDATAALLRVVDLPTLERQAVAATRARARSRGAGPLGGLTSLVDRWSGRQARVADPVAFAARWRDRGSLTPAVEPIRAAVAEALRMAPTGIRRRLAERADPGAIERDLGRAIDRAVAVRGETVPSSRVWPVIGLVQTLATLLLVVTAIWVVLWVLVKFPVDSVVVPVLGQVPTPLVVLIGVLSAGYLVARLLGLHAGWIGRRWARRLAAEVRRNVERDVATTAFAEVDAIEADRTALAQASLVVSRDCAPV
jgi:hypothetical protein